MANNGMVETFADLFKQEGQSDEQAFNSALQVSKDHQVQASRINYTSYELPDAISTNVANTVIASPDNLGDVKWTSPDGSKGVIKSKNGVQSFLSDKNILKTHLVPGTGSLQVTVYDKDQNKPVTVDIPAEGLYTGAAEDLRTFSNFINDFKSLKSDDNKGQYKIGNMSIGFEKTPYVQDGKGGFQTNFSITVPYGNQLTTIDVGIDDLMKLVNNQIINNMGYDIDYKKKVENPYNKK
jgi:hypothetical protein